MTEFDITTEVQFVREDGIYKKKLNNLCNLNIHKFVADKVLKDKHITKLLEYYELCKSYKYKSMIINHICDIYNKTDERLASYKILSILLSYFNSISASNLSKVQIDYILGNTYILSCYQLYNSATGMLKMKQGLEKSLEYLGVLAPIEYNHIMKMTEHVDVTYDDVKPLIGEFIRCMSSNDILSNSSMLYLKIKGAIKKCPFNESKEYLKSLLTLFAETVELTIRQIPFVLNFLEPLIDHILCDTPKAEEHVMSFVNVLRYYYKMQYCYPEEFHNVDIIIRRISTYGNVSISDALEPVISYRNTIQGSCSACGGTDNGKTKLCVKCKDIRYCSLKCQKEHWYLHKSSCCKITSKDRYEKYICDICITDVDVIQYLTNIKKLIIDFT